MPRKKQVRLKCPTCKKLVTVATEEFPFCSQRCRLIDLGKWASGQYVVSSPLKDADYDDLEAFDGTDNKK